jgi:hypothetical protein
MNVMATAKIIEIEHIHERYMKLGHIDEWGKKEHQQHSEVEEPRNGRIAHHHERPGSKNLEPADVPLTTGRLEQERGSFL